VHAEHSAPPAEPAQGHRQVLQESQKTAGSGVEGRPALLDIAAGRGHVIAYNFNPMHRDLNRSDFRLLWNAILNCKAILEPRAQWRERLDKLEA